ncbi:MAG: GNAT family N-acetyltransferase [Deltaproteobacteria bacterium]|nr:GNAT family N-acetyltransferase [Deltaproteobacteria bacterium]
MVESEYWADRYIEIKSNAEKAISKVKSGQRVFIGSSCGEPQHLVKTLSDSSLKFTDLEIVRLLSLESSPLTMIASKSKCQNFNVRSFYLGSAKSKSLADNSRFITPVNLSAIPRLFKSRLLPIHVALIQVSPPDDFGWLSLGISVDITYAAAQSADLVIAQVNTKMPRVLGRSFIHVNDVDIIVENDEELLAMGEQPDLDSANEISKYVKKLIEDGSTLQTCLGSTPNANLLALSDKNDLGIHTQHLTDGIMRLVSMGVVTNKKKGFNDGKIVASTAIGTKNFYEIIHDNPAIEFHPSDYVNNPGIISRHNKMVSMNTAMAMDLTGQVASDALPYNNFTGVTGILDFVRGASMSENGKSILMLTSTSANGTKSRIVPTLKDTAVVIPRGDVQYVVTEYGFVNLFGKTIQERAMAMISISHPDFREELFCEAKDIGLLGPERTLDESMYGVYPIQLEEEIERDGESIAIRPVKRVDERRMQEHYYNMSKKDIVSRFFHEKTSFVHDDIDYTFEIDYKTNLTIVAVYGELGFGKVIAVGEYMLNQSNNMAEIAFSTLNEWQGKGISKIIMMKLAEAARENGIKGFVAYTSPGNKGMISLFNTLAYKVETSFDEDMLCLSCNF